MKKIYLVTEDGKAFEGYSFGAEGNVIGELVFNTGMVGYIETLTDPSYYGQILVQTFPMMGNYGIIPSDFEGKPALKALVVREWCDTPSNFRCEYDLDKFLKDNGIVGIYGIDTREITKYLRENGTVNAVICDEIPESLDNVKEYKITGAVEAVSCNASYERKAKGERRYNVCVLDLGVKSSIIDELCARGCNVTVVPALTSAKEILALKPDGILLSSGPADPADCKEIVEQIKALVDNAPIFGIGLGHQLLAIANGASTSKLKYGHRGANQPSHKVNSNRTYITLQNNGYTVLSDTVVNGEISFVNANDNICEGIEYADKKAFSVQFYPESAEGLHSTSFLYDKFIRMMGGN